MSALSAGVEAALSGDPSLILISGEPGIGKTRLAQELGIYAQRRGLRVLAGSCFETHAALGYFPFVQALGQYVTASPAEAFPHRLGDKASPLVKLLPELDRRMPNLPRLARGEPALERIRLFDSVAAFMCAIADLAPILLQLEDLHWADEASLALLVHLVRGFAGHPLLIVATYRETDIRPDHPLVHVLSELRRERSFRQLRLKGLSAADVAMLLERLSGGGSGEQGQALAVEIQSLTDGNPLFIEQLIRQLSETGGLLYREGKWVAEVHSVREMGMSEGVLEVVDGRVARLSALCKAVLTHASVLGSEFEFEVLAVMSELAPDAVLAAIEEARAARLVVQREAATDHAFIHALVRQSLYEKLSIPRRRALHARAARAIEAVHQSNLAPFLGTLALHYISAGAAGDSNKAIEYSAQAGEAAYAVCAFEDAAYRWRAALSLAERHGSSDRRAHLLELLAEAILVSSKSPLEAAKCLETALELYEGLGEIQKAAAIHAKLVTLLAVTSAATDVSHARSHFRQAENLLDQTPDEASLGALYLGRAIIEQTAYHTAEGLEGSRRAMEIGQRLKDDEMWCVAAAVQGHLLWASGQLRAGFELLDRVSDKAERLHGPKPRFAVAWSSGFSNLLLWDPLAAEASFNGGLIQSPTAQAPLLRQTISTDAGFAKVFAADLDEARRILAQAPHRFLEAHISFMEGELGRAEQLMKQEIERSRQAQNAVLEWASSFWLARLYRVRDQFAAAERVLLATSVMAPWCLRVPEEVCTRAELALLYVQTGLLDQARLHLARCSELMVGGEDWRGLGACVTRAEAALCAAQGLREQANAKFADAAMLLCRYHVPWEEAEALVCWGRALMLSDARDRGLEKLDAAVALYRNYNFGECWIKRAEGLKSMVKAPPAAGVSTDGTQNVAAYIGHSPLKGKSAGAQRTPQGEELSGIYSLVTTTDLALLATLTHDAIAHLMNAIDKASKLRTPIDRIADAMEKTADLLIHSDAKDKSESTHVGKPARRSNRKA